MSSTCTISPHIEQLKPESIWPVGSIVSYITIGYGSQPSALAVSLYIRIRIRIPVPFPSFLCEMTGKQSYFLFLFYFSPSGTTTIEPPSIPAFVTISHGPLWFAECESDSENLHRSGLPLRYRF
ncbi:hypothetical protein Hypma_004465 [Hypsizygus marmoreus]|uniref:Uncharacterized protein n=1 Tax=Hypsizygus marmoreus TaxID=39966 RepID=A0A369K030_HYPMA|nr:hypothetical protein Hypma_004465 [Hypsizygus marmoreus]